MAGINKVDYKLGSLTEGFASPGDEVRITSANAPQIEADVKDERTEDLTKSQEKYLQHCLGSSEDKTDYETGEGEGEGEGEGDTKDANGPGAKEGVGAMAATGAAMFFGTVALEAAKFNTKTMCAWAAPWVGAVMVAAGAGSIVSANLFDSEYSERLKERDAEEQYKAILEESATALMEDIDSLKGNKQLTQLLKLNDEYNELVSKGEKEKAEAIVVEMEGLRTELLEGDAAIDLEGFEENNTFAHDFVNHSESVAEFLKVGTQFGMLAKINSIALGLSTIATALLAVFAFRGVTVFNAPQAIVGAALCSAAAIMFGVSTGMMINKTVKEYDCGAKGNELDSAVAQLQKPLEQHDSMAAALGIFEEAPEPSEDTGEEPTTTDGGSGSEGEGDGGSGSGTGTVPSDSGNGSSSSGGSSSSTT